MAVLAKRISPGNWQRRRRPIDTARERFYSEADSDYKDVILVKPHYYWLLAAVVVFSGCGREERREAVRFCKTLQQKHADFASANAIEKDLFASARSWCSSIIANGAGRADQLDQNAGVAKDLAKSAAFVSTQVGLVRQAIYDESLKTEYPQSIRTTLITQLTKRQRSLQELRAVLDDTAPGFLELKLSRDYTGDTYPGGISKLDAMLGAAKDPTDVVGGAVASLKEKYSIQDADLAK
jgi:hypothetical protein